MKHSLVRALVAALVLTVTVALALAPADAKKKNDKMSTGPDSVVLFIGNRMFPDFADVISTPMHRRNVVGDSDFAFEVLSFNPDFFIDDSTKTVIKRSDEPKNPAFRIMVYKDNAAVDSSWAFYNLDVPHFSRTSALWFKVMCFNYRGQVFKKEPPKPQPAASKDKK
jgi:hypothetical protein